MNKNLALCVTAAALSLTGCYKTNFTTGSAIGAAPDKEIRFHHRLIYGLVELNPVEADQICPTGIAKVHTEVSFLNWLVQQVTYSLYNPSTVQIWCKSGSAYNVELTEDGDLLSMTEAD